MHISALKNLNRALWKKRKLSDLPLDNCKFVNIIHKFKMLSIQWDPEIAALENVKCGYILNEE